MSHTVALLLGWMAPAYMCCQFKESEGENLRDASSCNQVQCAKSSPSWPQTCDWVWHSGQTGWRAAARSAELQGRWHSCCRKHGAPQETSGNSEPRAHAQSALFLHGHKHGCKVLFGHQRAVCLYTTLLLDHSRTMWGWKTCYIWIFNLIFFFIIYAAPSMKECFT